MKIIQITPGVISIPPNGWGAVEKVIWEYKQSLDKLSYHTDILYADDVKNTNNQIVHVHMANLAINLRDRGIPYVFSLHDHHVEYFGKDSDCYKQNYEAIKSSKLTFVHSKHLIEYFDKMSQIVYLPHGANLNEYKFLDRSERVRQRPHKLVMMANNGIGGDPLIDRKGFLLGIEAAKEMGLELSIICPSKGNKEFFNYHKPIYDKLNIYYDLDHLSSILLLSDSDIFLHPSNLEAGHPNLTLVESVSMGIPVVGVLNTNLNGMIRVERSVESLIIGIKKAIDKYDSLVQLCSNYREDNSWDVVVCRMLQEYKLAYNISEKDQLLFNYNTVEKNHKSKLNNRGFISNFKNEKAFIKISIFSHGLNTLFIDKKTNRIIYNVSSGKEPSSWAYSVAQNNEFIDWRIEVKEGNKILYSDDLKLKGNRVLLKLITSHASDIVNTAIEFQEKSGCFLTIKSNKVDSKNICFDINAEDDEFYFTMNEFQLIDYLKKKEKLKEKELFILESKALGDTLGFIPYAQKYAEEKGTIVDVSVILSQLFDSSCYPNINLTTRGDEIDISSYTNISKFEYFFDVPLQEGYSNQFEFEYEEIRPKVKFIEGERPIKSKYVCIGIHSTAQCKYWNYPDGWEILCKNLRKMGYTPVSLDMHELFGIEGMWNKIPNSSVKKLGMSLDQIILYLQHCEFFIGLSSGLSWLAWAVGKKVVMISGTTDPKNEFKENNIRIHNDKVCNGCFNKRDKFKFNPGDWMWCPENKGTTKWFECTTSITPDEVMNKIIEAKLV